MAQYVWHIISQNLLFRSGPYQLFVRELVAIDGSDMSEFVLIDHDGCPTDLSIMRPIEKRSDSGHVLETNFEAFKFPTSELVQFRALITPCVANCDPIKCSLNLPSGRTSQMLSYGKRKRRSVSDKYHEQNPVLGDAKNDVVVIESLSVTDKFSSSNKRKKIEENEYSELYENYSGTKTVNTFLISILIKTFF